MKKALSLLLSVACLFACLSLYAETPVNASLKDSEKTFTRHFDYRNFTGLAVSNAFHVELTFADTWSVDVTVPEFVKPYLKVSCTGNKVRIGLEKLPRDVQRKMNDMKDPLQAKVSMPKLLDLSLSGASRLTTIGSQVLRGENLYIDISGASRLNNMAADGNGTLNISVSGSSHAEMESSFDLMNIDVSGASKYTVTGNSGKINIDCSGASGMTFDGDVLVANVDVSGSSKVGITGKIGSLKLDQSGATRFSATGEVAQADVELSGASKGRLVVKEKLSYELSGASTLRVKNLGATVTGEQSRGSKIDFER